VGKSTVVSVKSSKAPKRKVFEVGSGKNDAGGQMQRKKKKKATLTEK
jgi:hypothetical protein